MLRRSTALHGLFYCPFDGRDADTLRLHRRVRNYDALKAARGIAPLVDARRLHPSCLGLNHPQFITSSAPQLKASLQALHPKNAKIVSAVPPDLRWRHGTTWRGRSGDLRLTEPATLTSVRQGLVAVKRLGQRRSTSIR